MKIEESKKGGRFRHILVMSIEGRLGAETAADFQNKLVAALDRGEKSVLIDLSKLEYISSAGMRVFLIAAKRLEEDGKFAVCGLTNEVAEVFRISGFDTILNVFPDEAASLAALM